MPKTIQVKDNTYRMLDFIRRKYGLRSFNDVIENLVLKELGLPSDMFGVDRGRVKPFTDRDRMEDRGW
jgi:predicted CopG family antitoxin